MPDSTASLDIPTRTDECDELLREWLADATARFEWLKAVSASREVAKATRLFGTRSGRARGRIALQRAFEPATAALSAIGDEGRLPFLCWVFFRPRDESRTVSVNFAMVLRFPDGRVSIVAMTWTADVAHDALSEALRHGEQDLDALLMELHERLLDAPADVADVADVDGPMAVQAGQGCFVGRFERALAGNEPCIVFKAQRWVPGEPEDAEPIGAAGEGESRLSEFWLDPTRLAGAQFGPEQHRNVS